MKAFSTLVLLMLLAASTAPPALAQTPGPAPIPESSFELVTTPMRPGEVPMGHRFITGIVSYGAQPPPPMGAQLDLSLEDVSRADAPADVIAVGSVVSNVSPPHSFDLLYDPTVLKENHRYVIRAEVIVDGAVLFVSDKSYPVLGAANVTHVNMMMRRANPANTEGDPSAGQLEDTYWKLVTLGDEKVVTPAGAREIHFVMQAEGHRVHGFSGCNGMMGNYTVNATWLSFSQMGGTMMACTNGMELEHKFHQMFLRVAAWKIEDQTLQLLDGAGMVLAAFEWRRK